MELAAEDLCKDKGHSGDACDNNNAEMEIHPMVECAASASLVRYYHSAQTPESNSGAFRSTSTTPGARGSIFISSRSNLRQKLAHRDTTVQCNVELPKQVVQPQTQLETGEAQQFVSMLAQSLNPDPNWTPLFPLHVLPLGSMNTLSIPEKAAILKDLQSAQAPASRSTIASKFRKFWHYTSTLGESPLPVSEGRVLTYIQYLRGNGSISALSAPQYVSAILSISRWFGSITSQPTLAADLLRSWKLSVIEDITVNQARPLPAQLFVALAPLLESITANLKTLRAVVAIWAAFMFFSRGDSVYAASRSDFVIRGENLEFVERRHKRKRVEKTQNFVRTVPCGEFKQWLSAMQSFMVLRDLEWKKGTHMPSSFWQLPGERPPGRSFLSACFTKVEEALPTHFGRNVFTSHSCRRGAASSALSIGVPLERLSWWGGWSFNSASIFEYLDFSLPASPAATMFFGWLKTSPAGSVPATSLSDDDQETVQELSD